MGSMTEVQINDVLRAVHIYEKAGHRVTFFAAFSILKFKSKGGVPNQADCEKEGPISLIEVWPENIQKLWVPKPLTEKIKLYLKMICYLNCTELFINWFHHNNWTTVIVTVWTTIITIHTVQWLKK